MRTNIRIAVSLGVVGALTSLSAASPAETQVPDVPELDFSIDGALEGAPGDLVEGRVTPESVAANCNNDVGELQNRFGATNDVIDGFEASFYPDGYPGNFSPDLFINTPEQLTWVYTRLATQQVSSDPALAASALPQTFVMTFADIVTQEVQGTQVNYDPTVGEAALTVPDIRAGLWAVAATCVSPSTNPGVIESSFSPNTAVVEEFLASDELSGVWEVLFGEPFPGLPITDGLQAQSLVIFGAQQIGESLVPALVEPDALGFEIFCVLDDNGQCPGPPPTTVPAGGTGNPGTAQPATPVTGVNPNFTG